jgi:predicted PurR-regulated permease PerM
MLNELDNIAKYFNDNPLKFICLLIIFIYFLQIFGIIGFIIALILYNLLL